MNKRITTGLILFALLFTSFAYVKAAGSITVSNITTKAFENGAFITWVSSAAGDSQIRYAEDLASLSNKEWIVTELYDSGKINHSATPSGLKLNTYYVFEVRSTYALSGEAIAGSGHFTTTGDPSDLIIKDIVEIPVAAGVKGVRVKYSNIGYILISNSLVRSSFKIKLKDNNSSYTSEAIDNKLVDFMVNEERYKDFPLSNGTYNFTATIDSDNTIGETNENNNTLEKTITVVQTNKPDLIIDADGIRIIPKSEDQYGRYQIGLTIKNIGAVASTLNGVATLIYGTNHVDLKDCKLGNCFGLANVYNAKMNMNSLGKNTLAPGEKYELIFNKQNYLLDDIEFDSGVEYTFRATVDDEKQIPEENENNNIYTVGIVPVINIGIIITDVKVSNIGTNSAVVNWKTGVPSTGAIKYAKSESLVSSAESYSPYDLSNKVDHNVNLKDLDKNTTYYYQIKAFAGSDSNIYTGSFKTASTNELSNIMATNITQDSATISWTSGGEGNTAVAYATSPFADYDFGGEAKVVGPPQEDDMTNTHLFKLTNLKPNTIYYFRVKSTNLFSGDIHFSEQYTFRTKELQNEPTTEQTQESQKPTTDTQIKTITSNAKLLKDDKFSQILTELQQLRDLVKEQQTQIKYLNSLVKNVSDISSQAMSAINNFITYGVDANTKKLGAGERAAVINSYKSAFDKLPQTEAELADAIKIANGRFPSITSDTAEKDAKDQFVKIYKRAPDLNNPKDNAAIKVMAYGLRQKAENRNLNSERAGIKIFANIFGHAPKTTEDWNTMQAITYSGASR